LLILATTLPVAAAGGTYLAIGRSAPAQRQQQHRPKAGALLSLESFVVNLDDASGTRYLKVTIDLEMKEAPDEQSKGLVARLRDGILLYLSSLKVADALRAETKTAIKKRTMELANGVFGKGAAMGVYYKEFVMQ